MSSDKPVPGSPRDWLRLAEGDLAIARCSTAEGVLLESLCFHAQQAVEKSIKAVMQSRNLVVPRTHDIAALITYLINAGVDFPEGLREAAILTDYAVAARYPGSWEEIERDDYETALSLAAQVVAWAKEKTAG